MKEAAAPGGGPFPGTLNEAPDRIQDRCGICSVCSGGSGIAGPWSPWTAAPIAAPANGPTM